MQRNHRTQTKIPLTYVALACMFDLMGKVQQVLEMPNELHERLRDRAQEAGLSIQDYVLAELKKVADRPNRDEVVERIRSLPTVDLGMSSADIVRKGRDERAAHLDQVIFGRRR
jgi:hypothetical protein